MKPGYKTSEFWTAILAKVIAALLGGGFIAVSDAQTATGALSTTTGVLGIVLCIVYIATTYIRGRVAQKIKEAQSGPSAVPMLLALFLGGWLLSGSHLHAATPPKPKEVPAGLQIGFLNFGPRQPQQQIQPQQQSSDPAVVALLQQQIANQQRQIDLMQQQLGHMQSIAQKQATPAAPPYIIYNVPPKQELPGGGPRQDMPQGPPKQDMPQGPPKQDVPQGPPKQDLPGGPPKQDLPPGKNLQEFYVKPPAPYYQRYTQIRAIARPTVP